MGLLGLSLLGCAQIPDADQAFVARKDWISQPLGLAVADLERRGFSAEGDDYFYAPRVGPNGTMNIGLLEVPAAPEGHQICFRRAYSYVIAGGDRIICIRTDVQGRVIWADVGWAGAGL